MMCHRIKKTARAQAHVGSLYEPLTRFNDSENHTATDNCIRSDEMYSVTVRAVIALNNSAYHCPHIEVDIR